MPLLEIEESVSALLLSFVASMYYASSARWHFSEVPWLAFFRHPSFFGGRLSQRRGVLFLLLWYLLSAFLWIIILLLFKRHVPIEVLSYWNEYTYGYIFAAGALNIPSFLCYMVVVGRAKRLLRKYGPGMSQDIINSHVQTVTAGDGGILSYLKNGFAGIFSSYQDVNKRTRAPLLNLFWMGTT